VREKESGKETGISGAGTAIRTVTGRTSCGEKEPTCADQRRNEGRAVMRTLTENEIRRNGILEIATEIETGTARETREGSGRGAILQKRT
jgi:hypothetical protein